MFQYILSMEIPDSYRDSRKVYRRLWVVIYSTAFHPQSDGQSECTISDIKRYIKSLFSKFRKKFGWPFTLIEFAYNKIIPQSVWHHLERYMTLQLTNLLGWDRQKEINRPRISGANYRKVTSTRKKMKTAQKVDRKVMGYFIFHLHTNTQCLHTNTQCHHHRILRTFGREERLLSPTYSFNDIHITIFEKYKLQS